MVIKPQTRVRLYSNVDVDPNYQNALYFDSAGEQSSYFAEHLKYEFNDFQYVEATGAIRVPLNKEKLYDVSDLSYSNRNFGVATFYAFIDRVEYDSPSSSSIYFHLDVWQTWCFECAFHKSFVERETVSNDAIGANTIPEGLETGPIVELAKNFKDLSPDRVAITMNMETADRSFTPGTYVNGTWWGSYVVTASKEDAPQRMKDAIDEATGNPEMEIGMIYTYHSNAGEVTTMSIPGRTQAYVPRNNKLYVWPYCYAVVECPGNRLECKYETLQSLNVSMMTTADANASWAIWVNDSSLGDAGSVISCAANAQLGWVSDAYGEWCAQQGTTLIGRTTKMIMPNASVETQNVMGAAMNNIVPGLAGALMGGAAGSVGQMFSGVKSAIGGIDTMLQAASKPDDMNGSAASAISLVAAGKFGVYTYCMGLKAEYEAVLDDFFSMYGYKVNRVKDIELHSRKNWNYVKTVGANITGNIPAGDLAEITHIFDSGVTMWHTKSFDYGNLDNPIMV